MNYEEAKINKELLDNRVIQLSNELNEYNQYRNELGLIPDIIRNTEEYKTLNNEYQRSFKQLQDFNSWFMKAYKKEYLRDRRSNRIKR